MKKVLSILLLSLCLATIQAQVKPETVTNATVIKLFKAGLDEEIIKSKIQSSNCKFDLTDNGLIALKTAGVSNAVIKQMLDKTNPQAETAAPKNSMQSQTVATPAKSDVPDLEIINAVYFFDQTTHAVKPLEKQSATMKTQMKMLGYGGTDFVFQVPGKQSSSRFPQDQVKSFLINTGAAPADMFVLYRVEVKKNARQAIGAKFALTGMKGSQGVIATDIKMAKQGIYELIPTVKLEKGEYFFALKSATNSVTSSTDVYAFAVE